ncbi:MAG: phosphatase PAP2 family protein [Erysipelotrichia bacterium]|nr:phosphatase PAP2 family protein [Erysipelotrichia bacterium]
MREFIKKNKILITSVGLLAVFVVFTLLLNVIDVQAIGPNDPHTHLASSVGFAKINRWFHDLTGRHMFLYVLTDWGSLITIPIGVLFLVIGIKQLVKRKKIFKVDSNILALGCLYVLTLAAYLFFELAIVNYRPILIEVDGINYLKASYPSSTTLLAIVLLVSAIDQIIIYIKEKKLRLALIVICGVLTAFFVVARAISGVHWLTDIIGGILLSATLLSFYLAIKVGLSTYQNK